MKDSPNVVSTAGVATEGKVTECVPITTTVWPLLSVVVGSIVLAPSVCVGVCVGAVVVPTPMPIPVPVPICVGAIVSVLIVWPGMTVQDIRVDWPAWFVVVIVSIQAPISLHVVPSGQHPYMQQIVPSPQRFCCPSGVVQQVSP